MPPTTQHKHRYRHLALVAVVLLLPLLSQAQVRPTPQIGSRPTRQATLNRSSRTNTATDTSQSAFPSADTSATKGLIFDKDEPDSVLQQKVFFFRYDPRGVKINELFNPTLNPTGAQYHDPIDAQDGTYRLSTGVIGHPHFNLQPLFATGLAPTLQADEHEGYIKTPEKLALYQTLTPYSLLSYSSSLNKDYRLRVAHTQNVRPGWNLAFDYQLINPEGVFAHSAARNHYLDATTNYFSADSRLQAVGGFIFQRFTIDENGGLRDDSYFTSGRQSNQAGLPMLYSNAGSTHLRHDAFAKVTYNLVRQVEGYRTRDSLVARYDTTAADSARLVLDTIVLTDTLRPLQPRLVNPGVLGISANYGRHKRASYMPSSSDSTLWSLTEARLFWTNDAYPDYKRLLPLKVTLGITPRYLHSLLLGDTLRALSPFNPFAKIELSTLNYNIIAEAEIDNTLRTLLPTIDQSDYHAHATARLLLDRDTNSFNHLNISVTKQRSHPELRMLQTATSPLAPQDLWKYEVQYQRENAGGWLPNADLTLRATHLNHHFWYDTALAVHQGTQPFWLLQASLTTGMHFGFMHLDMQQLIQYSSDTEQLEVPLWATKNSLYADLHLFRRALRMQVGIDLRFHTRFHAETYHPATGLFLKQSEQTVGGYLWGDIFVNLQVKRATISVKAGHLNALWERQPAYLLLPHHPGQSFALTWSLTWHFFD